MPITVEIDRVRLRMTATGARRWSEIIAKKNVEQMKKRVSATGSTFPDGVDLFESGDLQSKVSVEEEAYTFTAEYAEYVDERFQFAGLSEQALSEIEPALEDVANTEFYIEETEG